MNWEAISAIGQLVGALAVVISLIYLAREIRSNARASRVASMDTVNRWLGQLVVHPNVSELYYRGIQNFQTLGGADLVRFSSLMDQLFDIYEEIYYQRLEGHLEPRLWRHVEAAMRDLNAYPGVQAWWRSCSHWFDEEFAKHVDQEQQTVTAPKLFREANPNQ
jgi:hypothetical protein